MKQNLWILNSSLLLILLLTVLTNYYLEQQPPKIKVIEKPIEQVVEKKKFPPINPERIYKNDIFGTYAPTTTQPTQQSLVTPIPPEPTPVITREPELPKQEIIAPLTVTLKGIIYSSLEENSVAMFADETNKERIYHPGDKIKDGQILKISRNKVIILRTNGQEEIFLLRKDDLSLSPKQEQKPEDQWKYIIKKIDDTNYEIDHKEFVKHVKSLANFMENLGIISAYQNGQNLGLKITEIKPNEIETQLGLKLNDIIISINNMNTTKLKDRVKIYDEIIKIRKNEFVTLKLKRDNQDLTIKYKMAKLRTPGADLFLQAAKDQQLPGTFKLSPEQKREKIIEEFKQYHRDPMQKQVVSDVRNRFLENLRFRTRDRRVR
ncbi:MAG: type II secretion system protein N [Candidatus Babeliales bacterium]